MTVIKPEFSFFQMQIKFLFTDAIKFGKTSFGKAPKRLNAIDVTHRVSKLIMAMMNPEMLIKPNINQSIIAPPGIGMNNAFWINFAPYNALKRLFSGIWNNFGIDFSFTFKDTKDDGFPGSTTSTLARNTTRPKVRLINLYGPGKWSRFFTPVGNFTPDIVKDHGYRPQRNRTQMCGFCSC
jgi:hypothetical protein